MWKVYYRNERNSMIRDICCPMMDLAILMDLATYEIVFDFEGKRYYCYIDAVSMNEALGIFFANHENVTYNHVIDHFEV